MSDKIKPNPIDAPEPIEAREGRGIFEAVVTVAAVAVNGFLAFAFLLTPTRLAGATRSARLKWQERQNEIHQAVNASALSTTNGPVAAESPAPTPPSGE